MYEFKQDQIDLIKLAKRKGFFPKTLTTKFTFESVNNNLKTRFVGINEMCYDLLLEEMRIWFRKEKSIEIDVFNAFESIVLAIYDTEEKLESIERVTNGEKFDFIGTVNNQLGEENDTDDYVCMGEKYSDVIKSVLTFAFNTLADSHYLVSVRIQHEFSEDLEFLSEITEKSRFLVLIEDKIFINTNHIFEDSKSARKMVTDLNIEIKEIVSGLLKTDDIILEAYVTDLTGYNYTHIYAEYSTEIKNDNYYAIILDGVYSYTEDVYNMIQKNEKRNLIIINKLEYSWKK